MKILITGITGVVGSALVNESIIQGNEVTAVIRPDSPRKNSIHKMAGLTVIECALDNIGKLPLLVSGNYDYFFHLGWTDTGKEGRNDPQKQDKNIEYTLKAVEAAAALGCKVFVGAGSQAEYGRYDTPINESFKANPETAYGKAKIEACKKSREVCSKYGIRHVWTRIFSVYGPNDSSATMVMYCINKLLKGEIPALSECTQIWDFLYSSDAAKALLLAAEKGIDGEIYNIGGGIGRQLIEYVKILRDAINPDAQLGIGLVKSGTGAMNLCADITKLKQDTGFMPYVKFEDGIKETIKWVKGV